MTQVDFDRGTIETRRGSSQYLNCNSLASSHRDRPPLSSVSQRWLNSLVKLKFSLLLLCPFAALIWALIRPVLLRQVQRLSSGNFVVWATRQHLIFLGQGWSNFLFIVQYHRGTLRNFYVWTFCVFRICFFFCWLQRDISPFREEHSHRPKKKSKVYLHSTKWESIRSFSLSR